MKTYILLDIHDIEVEVFDTIFILLLAKLLGLWSGVTELNVLVKILSLSGENQSARRKITDLRKAN